MENSHITVVNNTKAAISDFHGFFVAVGNGGELPEEIADLFQVDVIIYSKDDVRVIVDFADD